MPYCLYVRKSRADSEAEMRGEGETLSRHTNALLSLAKHRHFEVTQIYKEIVSGETIAARPVMQQLLSEVGQGMWEGVLVMEVERLARGDTVDQGIVAQTFKFSNTKIITPLKDYDPNNEFDEEYFEFGLFMSRREYKTINRRLQRGRLASVKEGKYVASQAPYGYKRVKIENDKGFTLEPNQEEADIVKLIFALYTTGEIQEDGTYRRLGVSLITRKLNEMHIAPRKSKVWSPATIRDILINPVYIGKVRWNWRPTSKKVVNGIVISERPRNCIEQCTVMDGKHTPIIDKDVFDKAQEYISSNPPRPVPMRKVVKNPLAGIVVCGKCGHKMVRRPYSSKYQDTLMCPNTACSNVSAALSSVEERIIESLKEWALEYRLKWENNTQKNDIDKTIEMKEKAQTRLKADLEKLYKQLDSAHDLLEQGVYSTDQFITRSAKLSERIKQTESDILTVKNEIDFHKKQKSGRESIIPKIDHLLDVYNSIDAPKVKNDMLKDILEKVIYTKNVGGRWHNDPKNFELILFPKIPQM